MVKKVIFHLLRSPVGSIKCLEIWSAVFPKGFEMKPLKAVVSKQPFALTTIFVFVFLSVACFQSPALNLPFPKAFFYIAESEYVPFKEDWKKWTYSGTIIIFLWLKEECFLPVCGFICEKQRKSNCGSPLIYFQILLPSVYDKCASWWN